jgi:hypothetical protein
MTLRQVLESLPADDYYERDSNRLDILPVIAWLNLFNLEKFERMDEEVYYAGYCIMFYDPEMDGGLRIFLEPAYSFKEQENLLRNPEPRSRRSKSAGRF